MCVCVCVCVCLCVYVCKCASVCNPTCAKELATASPGFFKCRQGPGVYVFACACMCLCVCVLMFACAYVRPYIPPVGCRGLTQVPECLDPVEVFVCLYVYVYLCVFVCMYVCVCVCVCVCVSLRLCAFFACAHLSLAPSRLSRDIPGSRRPDPSVCVCVCVCA